MALRPFIVVFTFALIASACSSANEPAETSTSTITETTTTTATTQASETDVPTDYSGFRSQPTACGAEQPAPAEEMEFDGPDDMNVTEVPEVTLHTSCGPIVLALNVVGAPETVNSFIFLAEQGYFDGTASHRVIPGFMMQAGDPTATGRGGPGYTIPDEVPESGNIYRAGTIAMANAGPNTGGSQFFILFDSADWLPPDYTAFGQVAHGLEVLEAIEEIPLGAGPTSADGTASTPLNSLYIDSVTIKR